jgi:hypothetical protein
MYLGCRRKKDKRNVVVKRLERRERFDNLTLKHYLLRKTCSKDRTFLEWCLIREF